MTELSFPPLDPPEFLTRVRDLLRDSEPQLWEWFASGESRVEYEQAMRVDLLKSTYRLDEGAHPEVHAAAREAAERIGVERQLFLYQTDGDGASNAMLASAAGEAHIVLTGTWLERLTVDELRAVLGHELGHALLWDRDEGSYRVADRVLLAMAEHEYAEPSHIETAQRFSRYVEVFCDRAALVACRDLPASVRALVKATAGLKDVSAESYLQQAEELLAATPEKSEGTTHPRALERAWLLAKWGGGASDTDDACRAIVEGPQQLDTLDLVEQHRLTDLTRSFLDALFVPKWMRSEAMLGQAALYFAGYQPQEPQSSEKHNESETLWPALRFEDEKLRDYFLFLLLDFAIADDEFDDATLAWFLQIAERLESGERFDQLLKDELKQKDAELQRVRRDAAAILERARGEVS